MQEAQRMRVLAEKSEKMAVFERIYPDKPF